MKQVLYFLVTSALLATGANAQIVTGNAFIKGQYVEVGINQCGGWGTTANAPAGYHARSGTNASQPGDDPLNLGFTADPDKDGWTVGSPSKYNGDYFLPANPWVGWAVSFNGNHYATERTNTSNTVCNPLNGLTPFSGTNISATALAGGGMRAVWRGTNNGLQLQKVVTVRDTSLYFTVQIKLKNTTSTAINNIYYGEYVNPDNDCWYQDVNTGNYTTKNTIVYQNPTDNQTLVKTEGSTTQTYLGLGSKDCRAKTFRIDPYNLNSPSGNASNWYAGAAPFQYTGADAANDNRWIGIAYNIGTLSAGDSTTFTYTYILKATDFNAALAETDPGFQVNNANTYVSGAPALVCPNTSVPLSITNGDFNTWSWSPATGLNTTVGPNVVASFGSTPITYTATGTGPCGTKTVMVTLSPVPPRLHVDSSVAVSGTGASWASPLKTLTEALIIADTTNCINDIWVKKGTYFPMINQTIKATSRDSSLRIMRNGIKVYGGFGGTDTTMATRNVALYPTILSGDLGTLNDSTDNAYHVLTIVGNASNNIDTNTIVDGFTVTRGRTDLVSSIFTVSGVIVYRDCGGGINCAGTGAGSESSPLLRNITFTRNSGRYGGGLFCQAHISGKSSPVVRGCAFTQNRVTGAGGGLHAYADGSSAGYSKAVVEGSAFSGNYAENNGGSAYCGSNSGAFAAPVFTNCTFTNERVNTATNFQWGGALALTGSASNSTITGCTFTNCEGSFGGAIIAFDFDSLSVSNSTFTGNKSPNGGGAIDFNVAGTAVRIAGCTFIANKSGVGGAINVENGSLYVLNTKFNNDTATAYGAAIRTSSALPATVTDCQFTDGYGIVGAIDLAGGGAFNVLRSVFAGNKATQVGGVMNAFSGAPTFRNCVMYGNSVNGAGAGGGAVHVQAGVTATFINSTLADNTVTGSSVAGSNALSVDAGATLNLNNSIVWGGAAQQVAGTGTVNYQNSLVRGGPGTSPNLNVNPVFIDPSNPKGADGLWATGDDGLRLDTCSPAINAGLNALATAAGLTTDITGIAGRIQLTTVDMGAYEHAYNFSGFPDVTINNGVPASPFCAGASVTFTATPVNGGIASYQWFRNSTSVQTGASPTYTTTALVNTDTVWVILTNLDCGYVDTSNRVVVTVTSIPAAPTSITGPTGVCNGTPATYNAVPSTIPGATSFVWSQTGSWTTSSPVSTTSSITYTPNGSNNTISVRAANICGQSTTAATLAVVSTSAPSLPSTISGGATPCAGSTQTYSVTAVTGATYTWALPPGWTTTLPASTTNSITVTVGSGTAATTLGVTATNGCGNSSQRTLAITPNDVPALPGTITGNAAPCAGVQTSYSVAAVANTTSYTWTVPANWLTSGTTNTTTLAVTPVAPSGGNITVKANNICGSGPTQTLAVGITTTPAQPGVITTPTAICLGIAGTYSVAPVTGATAYTWQLPSGWTTTGPTNAATLSATPGSSGVIGVTASNVCGPSPQRTAAVVVSTAPVSPAAIFGPSPVCGGSQNTYTVAPIANATSYTWTLPNGWSGSSTANTISATAASAAGSGTITVFAGNACGTSATQSLAVVVNAVTPTTATISLSTPSASVCPGVPITFTAAVTGGGTAPVFNWTRNNSTQIGVTGPTFTVTNVVSGDVIGLTMTSNAVCASPAVITATPVTLTVLPPVFPGININTQFSTAPVVCSPTQLNFVSNIVGGGPSPVYEWRRNGVLVSGNTPTYSASGWTNGDVVTARLTSNAQCATPAQVTSNAITVTVTPPVVPTVSISVSPGTTFSPGIPVTFTATVTGGGAAPLFQWYRNSQPIMGAYNPTYTTTLLTGGDTITARLISGDPCASPTTAYSNSLVMQMSTGVVTANLGGAQVGLYPNPNDGHFTVSVRGGRTGVRTQVQVLNALSQVVYTREVISDRPEWSIAVEVGDLAAGIYMLRLRGEDGSGATERFEIRHK